MHTLITHYCDACQCHCSQTPSLFSLETKFEEKFNVHVHAPVPYALTKKFNMFGVYDRLVTQEYEGKLTVNPLGKDKSIGIHTATDQSIVV